MRSWLTDVIERAKKVAATGPAPMRNGRVRTCRPPQPIGERMMAPDNTRAPKIVCSFLGCAPQGRADGRSGADAPSGHSSKTEPVPVSAQGVSVPNAEFVPAEGRSAVQCALLNGLLNRCGRQARVRHFEAVEWQSLTFRGHRHRMRFVADAREPLDRMIADLEDAEFDTPGAIVADVEVSQSIEPTADKLFGVEIEALTVDE
jgi:hypothetical protein